MVLLAVNWSAFFANVGQFILSFSILVVLHELGHFLPAKWFGCRVEKFYLFFNPWFSLWKKKVGETEYGLGWVPLGGYVKISGMIDESMDKEQLNRPAESWEFRSKPAWQRLIIMLGGVTVNFILALVLFAMILFVWGEERLPMQSLKYGIATDSLATAVGLRDGDQIKALNGKPVQYYGDFMKDLAYSEAVQLTVNRNGADTTVHFPEGTVRQLTKNQLRGFVTPRIPIIVDSVSSEIKTNSGELKKGDRIVALNGQPTGYFDDFNETKLQYKGKPITLSVLRGTDTARVGVTVKEDGSIGFFPVGPAKLFATEKKDYSFVEAIPAGANYGVERLGEYVNGIRLLFTSKEHKVSDNLGSVISIGKTFGGAWDWQRFWTMTALFSIILAFMNILPIPALDGGHALFTLAEMITGRKPSDKFMEYAQMAGMVLLLGLMLYAFGLDIWRLIR
ncbi:site-2 protease. Metallo peptidase. MEROPS family M50B [Cnuella takakiae]|uniref:Zinc metalloprotease n=1 Tax=Cnuella takakiae TaxID=1302690 RepID=A0A1M5FYY9_9BACT|nr:RIP metalloprotease RseP [Cnuella takakiae]OLY92267.1 RIP metalloprotease RseP [Cnuella takakiae]SHF96770.1 site-2 protease. Metallo peptidase. MEROPS family M50B [Cnuella takakiae]